LLFDPDMIVGAGLVPARSSLIIGGQGQALPLPSQLYEIRQKLLAFGRHDRFWMKLHAFNLQLAMSQTHNRAVRC
jgi:hypothetical protein